MTHFESKKKKKGRYRSSLCIDIVQVTKDLVLLSPWSPTTDTKGLTAVTPHLLRRRKNLDVSYFAVHKKMERKRA